MTAGLTLLQALVTGLISGALMKADGAGVLRLDVDVVRDEYGDYTNQIVVIGRVSGERLIVTVNPEESST